MTHRTDHVVPRVFELFGVAGAGKSTVARHLVESDQVVRVGADTRGTWAETLMYDLRATARTLPMAVRLLPRWQRRRECFSLLTGYLWQHAAAFRVGAPTVLVEEATLQRLLRLSVVDPGMLDERWTPLVDTPHVAVVLHADSATMQERLLGRGNNIGYAQALADEPVDSRIWLTARMCFDRILAALGSRDVIHLDANQPADQVARALAAKLCD